MTEKETVKIVTLIVMSYPASEKLKDENTLKAMVAVWKTIFKDDDARVVEAAVQKHIVVNKWPPSIAEVREQMALLLHPEIIPPDVAWAAVNDLLVAESEFGHFDVYDRLPEPIARVVETIGWSQLYQLHRGHYAGNKDGMDRVAFMDLYEPVYARAMEQATLPPALNAAIKHKKAEIGGETLKMLADVQAKRIEKERRYDILARRNYEKLLDKNQLKLSEGENA